MIILNNITIKEDSYTVRLFGYDEIWKFKPEVLPSLKDNGLSEYDMEQYNQYNKEITAYNRRFYDRVYQTYERQRTSYMGRINSIITIIEIAGPIIALFAPLFFFGNSRGLYGLIILLLSSACSYLCGLLLWKAGKDIKEKTSIKYIKDNPPPYKKPVKPKNYEGVEQYISSIKIIKQNNLLKSIQLEKCEWNEYRAKSFDDFFNVYPSLIDAGVSILIEILSLQENKANPKWWQELNPYKFEEMIAQWFEDMGFQADVTRKSGDGGVDIIITKGNYKAFVQCKRFTNSKVSVEAVRQLYGVVASEDVNQGIIVSLKGCTKDAETFILKNNIINYTLKDFQKFYANKAIFSIKHKIKKHNDNWIKIGPYFLLTSIFCTLDDAELYRTSRITENGYCYQIWGSSNCFILYGKKKDLEYFNTLL